MFAAVGEVLQVGALKSAVLGVAASVANAWLHRQPQAHLLRNRLLVHALHDEKKIIRPFPFVDRLDGRLVIMLGNGRALRVEIVLKAISHPVVTNLKAVVTRAPRLPNLVQGVGLDELRTWRVAALSPVQENFMAQAQQHARQFLRLLSEGATSILSTNGQMHQS